MKDRHYPFDLNLEDVSYNLNAILLTSYMGRACRYHNYINNNLAIKTMVPVTNIVVQNECRKCECSQGLLTMECTVVASELVGQRLARRRRRRERANGHITFDQDHIMRAVCCDLQMLSVQVPGCAGMERLGAPAGPRLRHEHRHHALEWESQQRLQAMVGRLQEMVEQESRARSAAAAERLGLPPSIPLPDGEAGPDKHLQIRVPYQQAELTRPSFQPPPNKSVSDVPEWA
ncbi:hypothetical protein JYU34_021241, partial [Plutella xylostella]